MYPPGLKTYCLYSSLWNNFREANKENMILSENPVSICCPGIFGLPVHFSHSVVSDSLWTRGLHTACQSSLSITNFQSLLKLMSIESVMPSNHLILCLPLLLPPSIFPSIRVFSNESVFHIRWPKDWSFSFRISPSNEYSGLISSRIDWSLHGESVFWECRTAVL